MRPLLFVFALLFSSLCIAQQSPAQLPSLIDITEWPVEWGGRPRDPFVGPDGSIWFCGQVGNYLARLNPATGEMTQFDVLDNAHPHNLIVDKQGIVWYAGNKDAHIGKLTPDTKEIVRFQMPEEIKDPHTLVFDHQGNIWFTAQHSNAIGRLDVNSGQVKFVTMSAAKSRPYGIKINANNQPWSVLVGTNKLATVDPNTFELKEVELPRQKARPRRIEITEDNAVWYVDYTGGYLGRYIPANDTFTEWPMPSADASYPYGMALDNAHRLWLVETGQSPNNMVLFDTKKETFISSTPIPSGGAVRHMYFDEKERTVWFGVDAGFISKASMK